MPQTLGSIIALWRYPVKSLCAEPLEVTAVGAGGIEGDRARALFVLDSEHARAGKPLRGKEHRLLHLQRDAAAAVALAERDGIAVESRDGGPHFDARPLSLLFDAWLHDAEELTGMTLDPLRFRPNLFVRAQGALEPEAAWAGRRLRAGSTELRVVAPIVRCVTPTYDVATGDPSPQVLRALVESRQAHMGIYCTVERAGTLRRGDLLEQFA